MIDSYSSHGMTARTGLPRRVTASVSEFSVSRSGKLVSSSRAFAIGISRIIGLTLPLGTSIVLHPVRLNVQLLKERIKVHRAVTRSATD